MASAKDQGYHFLCLGACQQKAGKVLARLVHAHCQGMHAYVFLGRKVVCPNAAGADLQRRKAFPFLADNVAAKGAQGIHKKAHGTLVHARCPVYAEIALARGKDRSQKAAGRPGLVHVAGKRLCLAT